MYFFNGTSINLVTPFGTEQALTPPQLMEYVPVMLTRDFFSCVYGGSSESFMCFLKT